MTSNTDSIEFKVLSLQTIGQSHSHTFPPFVCSEITPVNSGPTAAPGERGMHGMRGKEEGARGAQQQPVAINGKGGNGQGIADVSHHTTT